MEEFKNESFSYEKLIEDIGKEGYSRVRINKKIYRTDEKIKLARYEKHDIEIIIDKLDSSDISRLTEAIANAIKKSDEGLVIIIDSKNDEEIFINS